MARTQTPDKTRHGAWRMEFILLLALMSSAFIGDGLSIPDGMIIEQLERAVLETRLQRNNGNRTLTADQLGLSRRIIQRKIKKHNLRYLKKVVSSC